jgi:hypothetical protein
MQNESLAGDFMKGGTIRLLGSATVPVAAFGVPPNAPPCPERK